MGAAIAAALIASAWAGLLALSEESAGAVGLDSDRGAAPPVSPYREFQVSRLCLIFLAGVAAGSAVQWWQGPVLGSLGAALLGGGFLYMAAEALPRAVSVLAPDVAAAAQSLALRTVRPFRPISRFVTAVERRVHRALPVRSEHDAASGSVRRDLLLGVFSLDDTTVAEIMTPRIDMIALDAKLGWMEVVDGVRRSEHARIPVYRETLDDITGILYAKDLVGMIAGLSPPPARWVDLVRPAGFVPESKTLAVQLEEFQRGPTHIAIVVDEFGGTSGLVTLEDVLEEVVGEIHDEYDLDEPPAVAREGNDKFWVDGLVTVDELSALLGEAVEDDDISTVGGLVYAELGRVPRPGEEFRLGHFRVVVEQVVRRRIRRVYFERLAGNGQPQGSEERE